ncbi:hypothetical protein SI65_09495 [Aspergillus cristatus]|uniref:Zn(2)-C6 fungal-type domain-containing protein n=1 Tax=Aspergillus cristatus TaxID=573508 RepID=A0A1E3B217_ASPCR|nr:hypothetical protein SI65_09495 [Aspergillus cristatus]
MSPRNPHIISCNECRARKSKCSKERPKCAQCRYNQKECTYAPKISRTPLTRAYLTGIEQRLGRYETALERLFPTGDVERIVRSLVEDQRAENGLLSLDNFSPDDLDITSAPVLSPDQLLYSFSASGDNGPSREVDTALPEQILNVAQEGRCQPPNEETYVDAYFMNYHPGHPVVHQRTFRAEFGARVLNPPSLAWQILHKALMAMGAWTLGNVHSNVDMDLYNQAKDLLQKVSLMETGNLTLLQALLILSDFAQKRGMPDSGLQYLSIAVRMAIGLGLHRESPDSFSTVFEKEMKRRVWWTMYIFDSCAAKSFGLPLLLPNNSEISTKPVLNVHDENLDATTSWLPSEVNGPTLYTGLIAQSRFHAIANAIYRRLVAKPNISIAEMQDMEKMIDDCQCSHPYYLMDEDYMPRSEWLRFSSDRLRICDRNLRILLWRPYLLQWVKMNSKGEESENGANDVFRENGLRCLYAARESLDQVRKTTEDGAHLRLAASFLLYCLFHITLVFVISLRLGPALPDSTSLLRDIRTIKELVSQTWLVNDAQASNFLDLINRLTLPFDAPMDTTSASISPNEIFLDNGDNRSLSFGMSN